MRIHRLTLEAVGPFPGRHSIDVDELSAGGLFLLEGPTGAGKSTLIDAIVFGLYGSLGSPERDNRLPSAHAPGQEPVIEVVFSTGAGVFRVRRTPAFDRPKRRGEGTTRQNATAKLWRLTSAEDDAGESVSASTQEVGTEVQRIVGLTREQFSQTVVLPQGRFATFLRAKPTERADVLQDVFGTAVYQRVQDQLALMAKEVRRGLDSAQQEVGACVRAFGDLLAEDDDALPSLAQAHEELDAATLTALTRERLDHVAAESERLGAQRMVAQVAERTAQEHLDAQQELARRLERRRGLLAEQDRLATATPAVDDQRTRLDRARRAATVAGALRGHTRAQEAAEAARARLPQACAAPTDGPNADLVELPEVAGLRVVVTELTGTRGGLVPLLDLEATLPGRAKQLDLEEQQLATRREHLVEQEKSLSGRPEQRARLAQALEHVPRTAMAVPAAQVLVADARKAHDAAREVARLQTELTATGAVITEAAATAGRALQAEHLVRQRWIAGMAGELARELAPGEPCAVCGATEHPAPATRAADHADADDVEAAREHRETADAALTAARDARNAVVARLEAQQSLAGERTVEEAERALSEASSEMAGAEEAVRLEALRRDELTTFDTDTGTLQEGISALREQATVLTEQIRGAQERLTADRDACRRAAAEAESVAALLTALDERPATAELLVSAREESAAAARRLAQATTERDTALAEAQFPDPDAARAARLEPGALTDLKEQVRAHDIAQGRVQAGLAEPDVTSLTGAEVADVDAARAACEVRRTELTDATEAATRSSDLAGRLERARGALIDVLDSHGRATAQATPVLRMAELAAGAEGNARHTTLSTYVLLRRFEDVVAAANERLSAMSDGRYSLLRIDGREGRARKAGLGLSVRDHVTETERDPHTLSGGETFYVSLCLALGLADVVTSEAGGIALDTLFIDEGFGSLDPHTLDGVLGELDKLQAGGRAVGIVSHVSELKDRVADRISVRRTAGGASTLTVRAGT